jgi:hypothetical protein
VKLAMCEKSGILELTLEAVEIDDEFVSEYLQALFALGIGIFQKREKNEGNFLLFPNTT